MPVRYNEKDNKITKGAIPLKRIVKGSVIVYGEDIYNLIYTQTTGCDAVQIQRVNTSGLANDTSVITCSGESKNYDIHAQDTLTILSVEPAEGYLIPDVSLSSSGAVTQDVILSIGVNPMSYTLTYPQNAEGCTFVKIRREGVVSSEDLRLDATHLTATIYRDDVLSLIEVGVPEGYTPPAISFGGEDTPVTGDRTISITPNAEAYELSIPVIPEGVQVCYRTNRGSWTYLSATDSASSVTIYYNTKFELEVCALSGYKIPSSTFVQEGETSSLEGTTYSVTSIYGDYSFSAARTIEYTTIIGSHNYVLNILPPQQPISYRVVPGYGSEIASSGITYVQSPYNYNGVIYTDVTYSGTSSLTINDVAEELTEGTIIGKVTGSRGEGYIINSIGIEGKTLPFALQEDVGITAKTTQGTVCTISYSALPVGIKQVTVQRTSSIYSKTNGSAVTLVTEGGEFNAFGAYSCYVGDIISIIAQSADFYGKPTIGIEGDLTQTTTKNNIELTSVNIALVIQAGTKVQTTTFVNEATENVGYWNFKIVSEYPNSAAGIDGQGGSGKLPAGTHIVCVGDIISNEATNVNYARISLNEYRSPSLTLMNGVSALYTNERGNVEINVEGDKTYTCSYISSTVLANTSDRAYGAPLSDDAFSTVVDGVAERNRISSMSLNYTARRYWLDAISSNWRHLSYDLPQGESFSINWKGTGTVGSTQSTNGAIQGTSYWWDDDIGYKVSISSRNDTCIASIDNVDIRYTY